MKWVSCRQYLLDGALKSTLSISAFWLLCLDHLHLRWLLICQDLRMFQICSWMSFQGINVRLSIGRNNLLTNQITISSWVINHIVLPTNRIAFTQPCPDITLLDYIVRCFKKLLNKYTTSFIIRMFLSMSRTIFSVHSINGKLKFYFRPHKEVFFLLRNKNRFFNEQNDFENSVYFTFC